MITALAIDLLGNQEPLIFVLTGLQDIALISVCFGIFQKSTNKED